jgi:HPt (histidine-containing phosphotransfer) domain-containing protein
MSAVSPQGAAPRYLNIAGALQQIGDEGALREMLPMVLEALKRDLPAVSASLAQGDVVSANRLLHPLKGFIPIFSTPTLYEHVADVEQLSKKDDAATVSAAFALLEPELRILQAEVAAFLGVED